MVSIQQQGRRYYLTGNTYPYRDRIRQLGAHWDAASRSWWTAKKADADQLVAALNEQDRERQQAEREAGIQTSAKVVTGRCRYEGRTYYLLADGISREGKRYAKLAFRDGSKVFWAKEPAKVEVLKRYDEPTSIEFLRAYAEKAKAHGHGHQHYHYDRDEICRRCGAPEWDGMMCDACGYTGR